MAESTREEFIRKCLEMYTVYYDVEAQDEAERPLVAKCQYHEHDASFVISKKAQLWEANGHEYLYLFDIDHLTKELYGRFYDQAYTEGMKLVDPKPGHMVSRISAVIVCDSADPDAEEALTNCRTYKSFRFSLRGWMEFHTILILPSQKKIVSNRYGRAAANSLKKVLF